MTQGFIFEESDNKELVQKLREFRDIQALRMGVEAFKVLQYQTIEQLARHKPRTLGELKEIKGLGPKKIKEFGEAIIEIIAGAVGADDQIEKDIIIATPIKKTRQSKKATKPKEEKVGISTSQFEEVRDVLIKNRIFSINDYLDFLNDLVSLEEVTVQGEITQFTNHPTGIYMTLKDKESVSDRGSGVLSCYMSPYTYRALGLPLEEGMEVKAHGRASIFKRRSEVSFRITQIELAGEGSLKKALELLKKKLEAEGLFARKRDIPEFITKIGIITSTTGAVIGDFKKNLQARGFEVKVYDVRVEGAQALTNILQALRWFNEHGADCDVLILMRGGGSGEDFQTFNNETLCRQMYASKIPTIAALGHDRDVPLVSMVADRECSTPSIAAGIINESWDPLRLRLPSLQEAIIYKYETILNRQRQDIQRSAALLSGSLQQIFNHFEGLSQTLIETFGRFIQDQKNRIETASKVLAAFDPARNLKLGYSIVFDEKGHVIKDAKQVSPGSKALIKLGSGELETKVEKIKTSQ